MDLQLVDCPHDPIGAPSTIKIMVALAAGEGFTKAILGTVLTAMIGTIARLVVAGMCSHNSSNITGRELRRGHSIGLHLLLWHLL